MEAAQGSNHYTHGNTLEIARRITEKSIAKIGSENSGQTFKNLLTLSYYKKGCQQL
jgi:hypothetical protein